MLGKCHRQPLCPLTDGVNNGPYVLGLDAQLVAQLDELVSCSWERPSFQQLQVQIVLTVFGSTSKRNAAVLDDVRVIDCVSDASFSLPKESR